jgi:hypothetical protein
MRGIPGSPERRIIGMRVTVVEDLSIGSGLLQEFARSLAIMLDGESNVHCLTGKKCAIAV